MTPPDNRFADALDEIWHYLTNARLSDNPPSYAAIFKRIELLRELAARADAVDVDHTELLSKIYEAVTDTIEIEPEPFRDEFIEKITDAVQASLLSSRPAGITREMVEGLRFKIEGPTSSGVSVFNAFNTGKNAALDAVIAMMEGE